MRKRRQREKERDLSDLKYRQANAQEILDRLTGIVKKIAPDSSDEDLDDKMRKRKKRYGSKSPEDNQYVRYR